MKKVLATLMILGAVPLAASADVSKEDLKKLLKAGLSDSVILAYIRANGPVQKLSSDDLVDLKEAGATDTVMKACIEGPPPLERKEGQAYEEPSEPKVVERETVVYDSPAYYSYPAYSYYYAYPSLSYSVVWCGFHRRYDYCVGFSSYPSYGYRSYYYPRTSYGSYYYPRYSYGSYCWPRTTHRTTLRSHFRSSPSAPRSSSLRSRVRW